MDAAKRSGRTAARVERHGRVLAHRVALPAHLAGPVVEVEPLAMPLVVGRELNDPAILLARDRLFGLGFRVRLHLVASRSREWAPPMIFITTHACEPEEANRLYEKFCEQCRGLGLTVQTGVFAADMKVALVNDGPVTLLLDSAN